MMILDLSLDCLAYDQMGPAATCIRSTTGEKMYLVISYKRAGQFHELKVPIHYSAYFERPLIYFRHPYGNFEFLTIELLFIIFFYFAILLIFTFR